MFLMWVSEVHWDPELDQPRPDEEQAKPRRQSRVRPGTAAPSSVVPMAAHSHDAW